MAHPTLEYIRGLRKSLETKKAEIVGDSPSNMPGAEHDSKPDAAAKEPDKETKDQTMVPNSGLTTSGAGDDSKITHTNDLLAGEAALTPTKKPEVTGDADAAVPGGKTAEALAAEIISGVQGWYDAQKKAEEAKAADTKQAADTKGPGAGAGTAEALITDKGKEPEQTKDVISPTKKDEVTSDAMAPATGEGSSGETAAAAKDASAKDAECCADGKCGKCAKCKEASQKKAGALDMELTSDVLAKIAAVMLATEEGTKLAESVLAKAAGAEAAEKTIEFLRTQNDLAQKQAEYEAGQRDALALIQKQAQECDGEECDAGDAGEASDEDGINEIADTLDQMVESGEITEDEADQVVEEIAQAIADGGEDAGGADGGDAAEVAKEAQAVDPAAAGAAAQAPAAGDAAINNTVAVDPSQLDQGSVPQGGGQDISADDVADAIDSLVQSGEITEDEADQLVQEIAGGDGGEADGGDGDVSPEEIATALQEAVANGELKPEDVQQVLEELEGVPAPGAGAAAGADAGAAAGAGAGAAAGADAGAAAPADEPKTAGAKLLAAIQAARKSK